MPNPNPVRRARSASSPDSDLPRGMTRRPDGLVMYRWTEAGERSTVYGRTVEECLAKRFTPRPEPVTVDERTTLAAYLELWLEGSTLAANTLENHRYNVERWLVPLFGTRVRLADVSRELVRSTMTELRSSTVRGGTRIAPNTVRHAFATLSAAMTTALDDGRIRVNPCRGIDPVGSEAAEEVRVGLELPIPTELEVRRVIRATAGHRWSSLLAVAVATGLRQSELLGLGVDDLDLVGRWITVRRSLRRSDRTLGRVKNRSSNRSVPIPRALVVVLEAQLEELARLEAAAGSSWSNPSGLLFTDERGGPIAGSTLTHWFEDACRAELGRSYRWHDLRHYYASNLIARDQSIAKVARWLGHSSTAVTFSTYYHVIRDQAAVDEAELAGGVLVAM